MGSGLAGRKKSNGACKANIHHDAWKSGEDELMTGMGKNSDSAPHEHARYVPVQPSIHSRDLAPGKHKAASG